MTRTLTLLGCAVAVAAAIVVARACASGSAAVAVEGPAGAPTASAPISATISAPQPPALAPEPPGPPPPVEAADVGQLAAARDALLGAAAACVTQRAAPPLAGTPAGPDETTQKLVFRYHLVARSGTARAERVEPVTSAITDAALERCLLDAIAGASWSTDARDGETTLREHLRVGELIAIDRRAQAGSPKTTYRAP